MKYIRIKKIINIENDSILLITDDNSLYLYKYISNYRMTDNDYFKSTYFIYKDKLLFYNHSSKEYEQSTDYQNKCEKIEDKTKYLHIILLH